MRKQFVAWLRTVCECVCVCVCVRTHAVCHAGNPPPHLKGFLIALRRSTASITYQRFEATNAISLITPITRQPARAPSHSALDRSNTIVAMWPNAITKSTRVLKFVCIIIRYHVTPSCSARPSTYTASLHQTCLLSQQTASLAYINSFFWSTTVTHKNVLLSAREAKLPQSAVHNASHVTIYQARYYIPGPRPTYTNVAIAHEIHEP